MLSEVLGHLGHPMPTRTLNALQPFFGAFFAARHELILGISGLDGVGQFGASPG